MLQGAIIGAVVGLIYAAFAYFKAKGATGIEYLKTMPKRTAKFSVAQAPDAVMASLAAGVPESKATPAQTDSNGRRVVLAQPASFNNWGFFFPVQVSPSAGGGSEIEVGTVSRSYMWGAAVTRVHEQFVKQLQAKLGAQPAA